MKIKTRELKGTALDWAVAVALGFELTTTHENLARITKGVWDEAKLAEFIGRTRNEPQVLDTVGNACPIPTFSGSWEAGGPILYREKISVWLHENGMDYRAASKEWMTADPESKEFIDMADSFVGPSHLIAGMRCYVASKLGEEVDVPNELSRTAE